MSDIPDTPAVPESEPTPIAPAPAAAKTTKESFKNPFVWGTGRRKAAVARVRIKPGTGKFLINKKEIDLFFCLDKDRMSARRPLQVTDRSKAYDVFVNVKGGGISGQAGAVMLGLARALLKADADTSPMLRETNLLSRDARRVERKKYGRRGARRSFQFSKR